MQNVNIKLILRKALSRSVADCYAMRTAHGRAGLDDVMQEMQKTACHYTYNVQRFAANESMRARATSSMK